MFPKKCVFIFLVVLFFCICTGCNKKETFQQNSQENSIETELLTNDETQTASNKSEVLSIPHTQKELDEFNGTTDDAGHWTPPKGAYINPKNGQIYNKKGFAIGSTRPAPPNAVG